MCKSHMQCVRVERSGHVQTSMYRQVLYIPEVCTDKYIHEVCTDKYIHEVRSWVMRRGLYNEVILSRYLLDMLTVCSTILCTYYVSFHASIIGILLPSPPLLPPSLPLYPLLPPSPPSLSSLPHLPPSPLPSPLSPLSSFPHLSPIPSLLPPSPLPYPLSPPTIPSPLPSLPSPSPLPFPLSPSPFSSLLPPSPLHDLATAVSLVGGVRDFILVQCLTQHQNTGGLHRVPQTF